MNLRHELLQLAHACGKPHPALVGGHAIDLLVNGETTVGLWEQFGYEETWRSFAVDQEAEVASLMG
jgi:hypothetical protein